MVGNDGLAFRNKKHFTDTIRSSLEDFGESDYKDKVSGAVHHVPYSFLFFQYKTIFFLIQPLVKIFIAE